MDLNLVTIDDVIGASSWIHPYAGHTVGAFAVFFLISIGGSSYSSPDCPADGAHGSPLRMEYVVVDENIGEPESLVVSEETQEVQTLDTEVDDRDRDETEKPEEMSEAEEGTDDQPFVCFWPKCGKRFTYKSYLNRHKNAVHLKLKRFICDVEGCG